MITKKMNEVTVVGAGFAGCEAANFLAGKGLKVTLYEQKPVKYSPAHKSEDFAELVCSNSFKAARIESASGLLKEEMRRMGSVCLKVADRCSVPAGGALAVDRNLFSSGVTAAIRSNPNIRIENREYEKIDTSVPTIIATGPLTEGSLAEDLRRLCGAGMLSFFDAAAPIVTADSIDMSRVYSASRYGKGGDDYLNCFFTKDGYNGFIDALVNAETAPMHLAEEDQRVYEGCMPIEKLAKRGNDAPRFGPMKPVGLIDPTTGHRPWAAVQLRRENAEGTMYNIVGFQTNLKFPEQRRVFSMIPGLENAEFVRYGVMHRNTFLNSPEVLDISLSLKNSPNTYIAGQLSGFEGYMESACCGLLAAISLYARLEGRSAVPPAESMCGSILRYISSENKDFQPMGANMGVLPPLETEIRDKTERYAAYSRRSLEKMEDFINENCR